jgi:GT2 family glycosyltransferase
MSDLPTLAIIIVSWNVRDLLRDCLCAVAASLADAIPYEVLVVDNASHDGTPAMLRAAFPEVRLIESGANLGFAGGNNLALATVLREGRARYVLLLNPDTTPVGDAIPRMVRELAARPALAAVGPMLRYGDGSPQPSRRRFPTPATLFWESTSLDRLWPGNPWARRYRCAEVPDSVPQPVGWLVGAALLVRVEAIRRAGLLDERFFMYSEELEWQRRIQAVWGQDAIWYLPEAVIIHYEGKSSEQAVAQRQLNFSRSKILLARMWYGWGVAGLLRAFFRLSCAYEIAIERLKLALGHRRELRRQRIAAYWHVIRKL